MQALKKDSATTNAPDKNLLLATRNFKLVQAACNDALSNRKMVGLIGEAGYGKTIALKHFQRTHKNVFMTTVRPSMSSKDYWITLYHSLGIGDPRLSRYASLHRTLNEISEHLNEIGNSLLIFDEAGKFSHKMLEFVHELRDLTTESTGVIIAGPGYFKKNLQRWVKFDKIGMSELMRRINYWEILSKPEKHEMREFCKYFGLNDQTIIQKLLNECDNYGTLYNSIVEFQTGNRV